MKKVSKKYDIVKTQYLLKRMYHQLIKINETCLLFKRSFNKHDIVIINFGRKSMIKIICATCQLPGNVFEMEIGIYLGLLVIITQLFNVLYVYSSTVNTVAALQQMYEKSILSGFILSRLGKVDSEIRSRIRASKTPCNTTASHSA